jgi:hypothetical protein
MSIQANYLRTATVPLDELMPFPGNAKRGQVETILDSLRRNGQYRGLVVRSVPGGALVVLAGNHTMQALAQHGPGDCRKTVPTPDGTAPCGVCRNDPAWLLTARCEIVQCDDATARRINLADNRTSEVGTYDFEALAELLTGLDDLTGTGYSDQDVQDITALVALPQDEVKGQPAPAPSAAGSDHHGEDADENGPPDTFLPVINMRVSHATFDRWREALDPHPGKDDAAKLLGLLAEVETARGTA